MEPEDNPFKPNNNEIADTAPCEMMVDKDQEGNSNIDIKALFDYWLIIPHSRIRPLPNKSPPLKLILTNKP